MSAASKGASLAGTMVLIGGAAAWALLRATPAVPMAPEPEVIASDAVAAAPVAASVAEPVVPPAEVAAVAVATIDDGDAAGVAVASAKPAAPTDTAVPNRLSLSVDELVRAGLAQDVAEDLVDALNGSALLLEQPAFTFLLQNETVQIELAVAPLLPKAVADGSVIVTRADEIHRRTEPIARGRTVEGFCDGIVYRFGTKRGALELVVRDRAVPPEVWQRYVTKHAGKNLGSMDASRAKRAKSR